MKKNLVFVRKNKKVFGSKVYEKNLRFKITVEVHEANVSGGWGGGGGGGGGSNGDVVRREREKK